MKYTFTLLTACLAITTAPAYATANLEPESESEIIQENYYGEDAFTLTGQIVGANSEYLSVQTPGGEIWDIEYDDFNLDDDQVSLLTVGTRITAYAEFEDEKFAQKVIDNPDGLILETAGSKIHLKN